MRDPRAAPPRGGTIVGVEIVLRRLAATVALCRLGLTTQRFRHRIARVVRELSFASRDEALEMRL